MPDVPIVEIAEYHNDVVAALKLYFNQSFHSDAADSQAREARVGLLRARLDETDQRSAFFVLARLEAVFRVDYESRCQKKMKDKLSRAFREIWKSRKTRVSLDEDIFEAWRDHSSASRQLITELRAAFRYRHWLAHGRYWQPRLGRKYDFDFIYSLAEDILSMCTFQEAP